MPAVLLDLLQPIGYQRIGYLGSAGKLPRNAGLALAQIGGLPDWWAAQQSRVGRQAKNYYFPRCRSVARWPLATISATSLKYFLCFLLDKQVACTQ